MFISIFFYEIGVVLKKKLKFAICNPLLIAIAGVILFLLAFGISYESYEAGAKKISYFLTPATVCLAIPLYEQVELLKKYPEAMSGLSIAAAGLLTVILAPFFANLI